MKRPIEPLRQAVYDESHGLCQIASPHCSIYGVAFVVFRRDHVLTPSNVAIACAPCRQYILDHETRATKLSTSRHIANMESYLNDDMVDSPS